MAPISKISNIAAASISKVDGVAKASIGKFNNLAFAASNTAYVSNNLEFHINANDASSYDGSTTWSDLSGNGNDMTLRNGPTKPSGQNYVEFDGVDDDGEVQWDSSDYFYGSSTNYTFWDTFSFCTVCSWQEDGSTGFIPPDGTVGIGRRIQTSNRRGVLIRAHRLGFQWNVMYGTPVFIKWPNTSDFQYNSSRAAYEPKPDKEYHFAMVFDRTTTPMLTCYINGATFTPSSVTGNYSGNNGDGSVTTLTYANNSAIRKGDDKFYMMVGGNSNGTLAYQNTGRVGEFMLYSDALTQSEVQQNKDAYTDRYGALS